MRPVILCFVSSIYLEAFNGFVFADISFGFKSIQYFPKRFNLLRAVKHNVNINNNTIIMPSPYLGGSTFLMVYVVYVSFMNLNDVTENEMYLTGCVVKMS